MRGRSAQWEPDAMSFSGIVLGILLCAVAAGDVVSGSGSQCSAREQTASDDERSRDCLPDVYQLDIGDGVSMEFLLVPPGRYLIGSRRGQSAWVGMCIGAIAILCILAVAGRMTIKALRHHLRLQFGLAEMIVLVVSIGLLQYGGYLVWCSQTESRSWTPQECPQHEVDVTNAFFIGRFEVTQRQYTLVMGMRPEDESNGHLPITMVSWIDAQAFCERVRNLKGVILRLPTESEWELACRSGCQTQYCNGNEEKDLRLVGWYDKNCGMNAMPVGKKKPNKWGIHDMHGNVWEWCDDIYAAYDAVDSRVGDSERTKEGDHRVMRGGSFMCRPIACRSAWRASSTPYDRRTDLGFRVVVENKSATKLTHKGVPAQCPAPPPDQK